MPPARSEERTVDDRVWYLQRGAQQFGPYQWGEVVELARTGHVERTDLVFRVGDPVSRTAAEVPGLLAGAGAGAKPRWLMPALAAVVVLLGAVLVVVLMGKGDDDASDTTDTTRARRTTVATTVPATTPATTTTMAPTTTAAPTTTVPETTTTTTSPPTTTTLAIATAADLTAALPQAEEVPADWMLQDGPSTVPEPESGLYRGPCGLMDNDARAVESGLDALAGEQEYLLPSNGYFEVSLLAFPTPEDASAFLSLTDEQASACPDGNEFDIYEGSGPDQLDIFTDGYGDGFVLWHVFEFDVPGPLDPGPADERYSYQITSNTTTRTEGIDYGFTESEIDLYERYGRIVLLVEIYGAWDIYGFGGFEAQAYTPVLDDLLWATDQVRDGILNDLRAGQFIA